MLSIKVIHEGKTVTVKQKSITTRTMRELLKFHNKMQKVEREELELTELELIDELITITANMFVDPRVNFDSIIDSIPADELMTTLSELFEKAVGTEK